MTYSVRGGRYHCVCQVAGHRPWSPDCTARSSRTALPDRPRGERCPTGRQRTQNRTIWTFAFSDDTITYVWYRARHDGGRGADVQDSPTEVIQASCRRRSGNNSQGKLFLRRRLLSERLSVYDRLLFRPGAQSEGQTATPEIKAITRRSRGSEAMNGQSVCRSAGSDSL